MTAFMEKLVKMKDYDPYFERNLYALNDEEINEFLEILGSKKESGSLNDTETQIFDYCDWYSQLEVYDPDERDRRNHYETDDWRDYRDEDDDEYDYEDDWDREDDD